MYPPQNVFDILTEERMGKIELRPYLVEWLRGSASSWSSFGVNILSLRKSTGGTANVEMRTSKRAPPKV
ncbi:hypothetical protein Hypma_005106 [Hypsizygus marmoreus]|uniref:Uncharacterized protein n=1 Tax=Hypsizygus marmoreus TaxID=39966 RepID=A0A369JZX1_HYPMA|nr:hypothetical protein Hypma_005106 [Hypsizygus marmoreus]